MKYQICPTCKKEMSYLHARIRNDKKKYSWKAVNCLICLDCGEIYKIKSILIKHNEVE